MPTTELTLSEIWIYPIKSLGGVKLTSTQVMPKGLKYDRRWMLIDENGMFMTQRTNAQMALFKLKLESDQLLISYHEDSITLSFHNPYNKSPLEVAIWDDRVTANEVNEIYSNWFSDRLGLKCKLVYFPETNPRPVDPRYKVNNEHVSLADAYPFLIIGQSSLDDLNKRLDTPVPMNRFRPNFVFTGGQAYEEDTWRNFTIGSNRYVGVKPCARCVLTTVNQDTAEKGTEPLKTLATYRRVENKVLFGQNAVALDYGNIVVGDKILLN
jgi:hypothetical protein